MFDLSGHFITQMSSQGTWVRGEIYAAGEHIATYENDLSTPTTFFTHSDHLGTERVQTAVNGSSCETITNTAFGDGMNETGSCDPTALRFTDKLRDYETNLDDFGARFYSSQLGRFMSTDWSAVPAPVPYANLSNPQTLNLYAIVADNPVTFADLDGHCQDGDTAQSACPAPFGTDTATPAPQKDTAQKTGMGPDAASTTQKVLNVIQTTLDVATFIPLVGDVASGANAVISAGRGNWSDAAVSAVAAIPIVGVVGEVGKGAKIVKDAETLTRFGTEAESAEKLAAQAANAEENIGIHGVSVTARPDPRTPGSSAARSEVEKVFNVHNTGRDIYHRTVELAKPVTQAVADAFNRVFGRMPF